MRNFTLIDSLLMTGVVIGVTNFLFQILKLQACIGCQYCLTGTAMLDVLKKMLYQLKKMQFIVQIYLI